ncbi:hypothetical protein [Marinobacter sp.]|uniref:hypothetical protein n=1 Tax=Marinobacter sp. TaxID=50741 RepID=UPI00384AAC57
MKKTITVSDLEILENEAPERITGFLEHTARTIARPDMIYVTSSSELSFLTAPFMTDAIHGLLSSLEGVPARILSQACLGLYTAVQEFWRDDSVNEALVLFVEAPGTHIQIGLNAIGIGNLEGQEGLETKPGIGRCWLRKVDQAALQPDDIVIDRCEIYAVSSELTSSATVLRKLVGDIATQHAESPGKLVSFEVSARWSKKLAEAIRPACAQSSTELEWLPSIETGHHHYMSLKQPCELLHYTAEVARQPLMLLGLGGGGRIGLLRAVSGAHFRRSDITPPRVQELPFQPWFKGTREVVYAEGDDYYPGVRDYMLCVNAQYRGIPNFYFYWEISPAELEKAGADADRTAHIAESAP